MLKNNAKQVSASEGYFKQHVIPFLKNRLVVTFFTGISLIGIGMISTESGGWLQTMTWNWFYVFLSAFLLPVVSIVGGSCVAAAAVGFIMADQDYMRLLNENIRNILLNPTQGRSTEQLKEVWQKVTLKLLGNVLPFEKSKAVALIQNQFMEEERHYHFEDVECTLTFDFDKEKRTVNIHQKVSCNLVITPRVEDPILKHYVTLSEGGELEPLDIELNNETIPDVSDYLEPDPTRDNKYVLRYPLRKKIRDDNERKIAKYSRKLEITQNLDKDNLFATDITRFVKGYKLVANIKNEDSGYTLSLDRFGVKSETDVKGELKKDGLHWNICKMNDLLLPGEAIIIKIIKGD